MEEKFLKASEDIRSTKNLDNETLLSLYGYYKQATCGSCDIAEPYRIYYKEHAKYIAWNNNKDVINNIIKFLKNKNNFNYQIQY